MHWFGISKTIMTDQGTMFAGESFARFLETRRIKWLNSSLYYAHAEAMNKVIINMMKWHIRRHRRKWDEKLSEVLWACRT